MMSFFQSTFKSGIALPQFNRYKRGRGDVRLFRPLSLIPSRHSSLKLDNLTSPLTKFKLMPFVAKIAVGSIRKQGGSRLPVSLLQAQQEDIIQVPSYIPERPLAPRGHLNTYNSLLEAPLEVSFKLWRYWREDPSYAVQCLNFCTHLADFYYVFHVMQSISQSSEELSSLLRESHTQLQTVIDFLDTVPKTYEFSRIHKRFILLRCLSVAFAKETNALGVEDMRTFGKATLA